MTYLTITKQSYELFTLSALSALFVIITGVDASYAAALPAGTSGVDLAICNAVNALQGGVGTAIATIGVSIIGIGALLGKVSWGMAILVAAGIGAMFGGSAIIGVVVGDTALGSCVGATGIAR